MRKEGRSSEFGVRSWEGRSSEFGVGREGVRSSEGRKIEDKFINKCFGKFKVDAARLHSLTPSFPHSGRGNPAPTSSLPQSLTPSLLLGAITSGKGRFATYSQAKPANPKPIPTRLMTCAIFKGPSIKLSVRKPSIHNLPKL